MIQLCMTCTLQLPIDVLQQCKSSKVQRNANFIEKVKVSPMKINRQYEQMDAIERRNEMAAERSCEKKANSN